MLSLSLERLFVIFAFKSVTYFFCLKNYITKCRKIMDSIGYLDMHPIMNSKPDIKPESTETSYVTSINKNTISNKRLRIISKLASGNFGQVYKGISPIQVGFIQMKIG